MPIVRSQITMSADGYAAGPRQTRKDPLGERAEALHTWFVGTRTFLEMNGKAGGATGPDDDIARESFENLGATIMGRNMFGPIRGPWPDDSWKGWWGPNPPYHHPVFVLTHHPRPPLEMAGGTTFHFVTDGIQAALERAKAAAGNKDVHVPGGASVIRQYLRAGLIDELLLHVVPVLLGSGERLFEDTDGIQDRYEPAPIVGSAAVSHFRYTRR